LRGQRSLVAQSGAINFAADLGKVEAGMSDHSADPQRDHAGPLARMKPAARIVFGIIVIPPILAIGVGLLFVAIDIWRDGSRSMARTDWSFWTWPKVLGLLFAAVATAMLVRRRIRLARRRSDR
jgi:hypothetical protein